MIYSMAWAVGTILQRSVVSRLESEVFDRRFFAKTCRASYVANNVACNNSLQSWNVDATLAAYSLMRYLELSFRKFHSFFYQIDSNVFILLCCDLRISILCE